MKTPLLMLGRGVFGTDFFVYCVSLEQGNAPAGAPKGFPRGKQSARFALPCAPLVVCLNSGSLTAFGGCIHWMTVNFSNLI